MAIGGFAKDEQGRIVGRAAAEAAWLPAGRELLGQIAARPMATISQSDFAAQVQHASGVTALGGTNKWLAHCLAALAEANAAEGVPCLTSLVVSADGKVGEAYDDALQAYGVAPAASNRERESRAAQDRIGCYRWAGAPEPRGGWHAKVPVTRAAPTRERVAAPKTPERAIDYCPNCFTALPATGVCDFCA
jgi:hypothetical protein